MTTLIDLHLPDGRVVQEPMGTPVGEVFARHNVTCSSPILAAYLDNRIMRLSSPLEHSGHLRPVEHASIDGMAIYERSVLCLLMLVVRRTFPSLRLYVNHSLDNHLFCELHMRIAGRRELVTPTQADLARLEEQMHALVEADLPLESRPVDIETARELFRAQGDDDKAELLRWHPGGTIHLYEAVGQHVHFYGYLAPRTGVLTQFRLTPYHTGFLLQLPQRSNVHHIQPQRDFPKLYKQYARHEEWLNTLGVPHVAALNRVIQSGESQEIVLTVEALHEKRFAKAADRIVREGRAMPRVMCLAGPSSSGKTTTAKRLRIQLRVNGIECIPVGLDDYFVDRDATPRDEHGDYDFEAFEAIDHARLDRDIARLIAGDEVVLPRFDFREGCSKPGKTLRLLPHQVLLLEGIHALNPRLLPSIPDALKFRLYVSPITALNLDNTNRVRSSDVRVLRRMVRDRQFRGYTAEETLSRWASVRTGEEKHIFPYQRNADFILNTSLVYELSVLKPFAEPLLEAIDESRPTFSTARRLLSLLHYFVPLPASHVPTTSILREFIGDSVFDY
jgi:uridine kinase